MGSKPVTTKSGYDALMYHVCVDLGFCGSVVGVPLHVDMFIPETGTVTADQFVDWLFQAEGVGPTADPQRLEKHRKILRDAFVLHMGSETVDAASLKWQLF